MDEQLLYKAVSFGERISINGDGDCFFHGLEFLYNQVYSLKWKTTPLSPEKNREPAYFRRLLINKYKEGISFKEIIADLFVEAVLIRELEISMKEIFSTLPTKPMTTFSEFKAEFIHAPFRLRDCEMILILLSYILKMNIINISVDREDNITFIQMFENGITYIISSTSSIIQPYHTDDAITLEPKYMQAYLCNMMENVNGMVLYNSNNFHFDVMVNVQIDRDHIYEIINGKRPGKRFGMTKISNVYYPREEEIARKCSEFDMKKQIDDDYMLALKLSKLMN